MTETTHRAFFGDAERNFCLTPALIDELERQLGAGLGAIMSRLHRLECTRRDIFETIRLAMIGGGEDPQRAAQLIETYAARPIQKSHLLAIEIIDAVWIGAIVDKKDDNGKA